MSRTLLIMIVLIVAGGTLVVCIGCVAVAVIAFAVTPEPQQNFGIQPIAQSTNTPEPLSNTEVNTTTPILLTATPIPVESTPSLYLLTGTNPLDLFAQDTTSPPTEVAITPPIQAPDSSETENKSENETNRSDQTSEETSANGDEDAWWQVYFTDPNTINDPSNLSGSIAEQLIDRINQAESSIHIASFEFNLTPVAQALIAAHERGVEVLWVTDDEHGLEADEEADYGQFAMLEEAGIIIKDDHRSALMHNKFWIFDRERVWTGSTNITINGNFKNNNNVIVIDSPSLAEIYEREFDEMWIGDEFGISSTSTVDEQRVSVGETVIQVLFAAEDDVATRLTSLIEEAESHIRFMAFSFTQDEMGQALLERAKAGVDIRGIFETRGSETQYSELPPLYCADVPVRQDGNARTFHHKVMVIDEETLVTGSFNFSANANKSNDENVLIITHPDIAAQYLQEFDRRWAEAREPDAADMNCE